PATSSDLRPVRSACRPATRLVAALTTPKATMKERIALFDERPKSAAAQSGSTARSRPTIAPTNALTTTSSENCCQFRPKPNAGCIASGSTLEVACSNCGSIGGRLRDVAKHRGDERIAVLDAERPIEGAFESDRRRSFSA